MKTQTFYEYDYARDEHGNKLELSSIFEKDDAKNFQLFLSKNHIEDIFNITQTNIQAQNYVGVIKYKNYQFEILPKLLKYKDEAQEQVTMLKNLFYMLSYTKKLDIKESDIAKLAKNDNPFLEVLIASYANSLYDCLLRFIPKNYTLYNENLNYLKGKLKFNENIKYNSVNKARFYCEFDEFCEDNLLNRTFLFVTRMLIKVTTSKHNKKRLKQILNIYSEITFEKILPQNVKKLRLSRSQVVFEKPLLLAKMFIENASIEMSSKKFETLTLIFDMNLLFEEFIYELLRRNYEEFELNEPSDIEYQKNKKLIDSSDRYEFDEDGYPNLIEERNRACKNTFSDIVINLGNSSLIIDTKYKYNSVQRGHFNNDDAYQILAYKAINTIKMPTETFLINFDDEEVIIPKALLLYPKVGEDFIWKHYIDEQNDNNFFVSCVGFDIDLKKDLKSNKSQVLKKLKSLIKLAEKPSFCQKCKSKKVVEIQYGMPGPEMLESAQAGKIKLGGCCLPTFPGHLWYCKDCESEF
ncbi:MAG: hypothetical protein WCK67_04395 [bacterium]